MNDVLDNDGRRLAVIFRQSECDIDPGAGAGSEAERHVKLYLRKMHKKEKKVHLFIPQKRSGRKRPKNITFS